MKAVQGLRSPLARVEGLKDFGGVDLSLEMSYIYKPFMLVDRPHDHNFHQYLAFLGSGLTDSANLGGEVTLYLAKEKEKYVLDKPGVVHVPPGLVHAPLEITRITEPMLHIAVNTSPFYTRMTEYP
jgi:hypothetical protein